MEAVTTSLRALSTYCTNAGVVEDRIVKQQKEVVLSYLKSLSDFRLSDFEVFKQALESCDISRSYKDQLVQAATDRLLESNTRSLQNYTAMACYFDSDVWSLLLDPKTTVATKQHSLLGFLARLGLNSPSESTHGMITAVTHLTDQKLLSNASTIFHVFKRQKKYTLSVLRAGTSTNRAFLLRELPFEPLQMATDMYKTIFTNTVPQRPMPMPLAEVLSLHQLVPLRKTHRLLPPASTASGNASGFLQDLARDPSRLSQLLQAFQETEELPGFQLLKRPSSDGLQGPQAGLPAGSSLKDVHSQASTSDDSQGTELSSAASGWLPPAPVQESAVPVSPPARALLGLRAKQSSEEAASALAVPAKQLPKQEPHALAVPALRSSEQAAFALAVPAKQSSEQAAFALAVLPNQAGEHLTAEPAAEQAAAAGPLDFASMVDVLKKDKIEKNSSQDPAKKPGRKPGPKPGPKAKTQQQKPSKPIKAMKATKAIRVVPEKQKQSGKSMKAVPKKQAEKTACAVAESKKQLGKKRTAAALERQEALRRKNWARRRAHGLSVSLLKRYANGCKKCRNSCIGCTDSCYKYRGQW